MVAGFHHIYARLGFVECVAGFYLAGCYSDAVGRGDCQIVTLMTGYSDTACSRDYDFLSVDFSQAYAAAVVDGGSGHCEERSFCRDFRLDQDLYPVLAEKRRRKLE